MAQYIDKDALIAEIQRLKGLLLKGACASQISMQANCKEEAYNEILSFIDTLEVKEVDLEKELSYENYMGFFKEYPEYGNGDWGYDEARIFANYFFKLGLTGKQESNDDVKVGETQIYFNDSREQPYVGKGLDISCMKYETLKALFKDGDNVEIFIRKKRGE